MPLTCFTEDEIVDNGTADVNGRGAAYIAQKHKGKKVRWFVIDKDQE